MKRIFVYEHKIEAVSVILDNHFNDCVQNLKGTLPQWVIRRINEGVMAGSGANYPTSKLAKNHGTYHN